MPTRFSPLRLGDLDLPNRIVLAPLTRSRASAGRVPNALMADYYRQRSSARLMLEVTDAVVGVWGASRVGMHLAPRGDSQSMGDSEPLATFSNVYRQ